MQACHNMSWIQISVAASSDNYQLVEDTLLSLGAQSITYKDAADKPILEPRPGETPLWHDAIITGLFDDRLKPDILREQIRQQLDDDGLDIEIASLPDQDWTRAWMDTFKPMRFGERLCVCPRHIEPPEPQAINLRLDPGLAFGTGTHPTTSLCLRWLDGHVYRQADYKRVLDYGCGSGILAIAALLLGAEHADCVDIDEQALQSTRDNAASNQVLHRINTCLPEELATDSQYDLVLANILSGPLTELAPTLAQHCHPGSNIVLSGILHDQAESVRNAYAELFDMTTTEILEDWVLLHGKRKT
jgi:ribosomal protein L11 methyltransferase